MNNNFDIEASIANNLAAAIEGDTLFTALDISKRVQTDAFAYGLTTANTPQIRHNNLKNKIHEFAEPFVDQNVYKKELRDVGSDAPAYVYYPPKADVGDYVPQNRGHAAQNPKVIKIDDNDDEDGRSADKRGSLSVPLKGIGGIQRFETVYVRANGDNLEISRNSSDGDITSYTVDVNYRARLTTKVLSHIGYPKAGKQAKFRFKADQDKIVVKLT